MPRERQRGCEEIGAQVLWGEAVGNEIVQSGEEKAQEDVIALCNNLKGGRSKVGFSLSS